MILQNDAGNYFGPTTIVAAITGKNKRNEIPTHVPIKISGLKPSSVIMLEQIRTIDKDRIISYIGHADEKTMEAVNKAIAVSFGINFLEVFV